MNRTVYIDESGARGRGAEPLRVLRPSNSNISNSNTHNNRHSNKHTNKHTNNTNTNTTNNL